MGDDSNILAQVRSWLPLCWPAVVLEQANLRGSAKQLAVPGLCLSCILTHWHWLGHQVHCTFTHVCGTLGTGPMPPCPTPTPFCSRSRWQCSQGRSPALSLAATLPAREEPLPQAQPSPLQAR